MFIALSTNVLRNFFEWNFFALAKTIQKSQSYVFLIHQVFRQNVPINKRSAIICIAFKFMVIIDNKQIANYKL